MRPHYYGFESLPGQKSRPPTREQQGGKATYFNRAARSFPRASRCDAGAFCTESFITIGMRTPFAPPVVSSMDAFLIFLTYGCRRVKRNVS